MIAARRGRKPGTSVQMRCCVCGTVETASGANDRSCCVECKTAARYTSSSAARQVIQGRSNAQAVVGRAIQDGTLEHPSKLRCADCSGPASQYEHRDYNDPLVVVPVCRSCNCRRGPGIPKHGFIESSIRKGRPPYRLRLRAIQLMQTMGLPVEPFEDCRPLLTIDDWRRIWPTLIGSPDIPTATTV